MSMDEFKPGVKSSIDVFGVEQSDLPGTLVWFLSSTRAFHTFL